MARFLICTVPATGHVSPGLPISRALVERGHEVHWYTGAGFRDRIEGTGARFEPMRRAPDPGQRNLIDTLPEGAEKTGLAALKAGIKHGFLDPAPAQLADLREILSEFPADVLVSDTAFVGSLFLEELGGPPRAVYGIVPLVVPSRDTAPFGLGLPPSASTLGRLRNRALYWAFDTVLFRDVHAYYNRIRAQVGLPPSAAGIFNDAISRHLFVQGTTPSFEYPRSDLPRQVRFVGPFLPGPSPDFRPPAWWAELEERRRPVVHVTQGTETTDPAQLIEPTIRGLAGEDVLLVVTTGGRPVSEVGIDPLPENVRIEPFLPHHHLLPHVDVMVTNAGYGGAQTALANGVPLVAAGRTEEKPEVSARIAWSGAGINLKTHRPRPEQVRDAVREVFSNPSYRDNARRIQQDFAGHDAPREAAELLEAMVAARTSGVSA
jgi:MGT family glycosyltransferase